MIKYDNFNVRYNKLTKYTLENINLEIIKGEKVLIVGPSGCGKTTLSRTINGLLPNQIKAELTGTYSIASINVRDADIFEFSNEIGTILQDQDAQFVGLSVGEDVSFYSENNCVDIASMHSKTEEILKKLNSLHLIKVNPHQLSGGQKQRVSLAGVLLNDANILLFDEPLASLDPKSSCDVMAIIDELSRQHEKTIIVIEHRLEDVLSYDFDRIILINNGTIVYNGKPNDLLKTSLLEENNIRKPLYLELFDLYHIDYTKENDLCTISSLSKSYRTLFDFTPIVNKTHDTTSIGLEVSHLNFSYDDDFQVLSDVSFSIKKGGVTALLGNNGAGKSTITKIISGIIQDYDGDVQINGQSINALSIFQRAAIVGYVMQNPNHMITENTVYEEIVSSIKNMGLSKEEITCRVEKQLAFCSLVKYKQWPISMLSYGQKRRVTIASVLAKEPAILLLDEPTAGQDYATFKTFMNLVNEITKEGVSVLLITHNMQLALEYCDSAVILHNGRVLLKDTIENTFANHDVLTQASLMAPSIATLARHLELDPSNLLQIFGAKNNA